MKNEHSPKDTIDHYNLKEKEGKRGVLLVRVEKSMCGLAGSALALAMLVFWVCLGFSPVSSCSRYSRNAYK